MDTAPITTPQSRICGPAHSAQSSRTAVSEKTLGLERCHAAHAGRRDRLPIRPINNITSREHTRHVGNGRARARLDVSVRIARHCVLERIGRRIVTNRNKDPVGRQMLLILRHPIVQTQTGHASRLGFAHDLRDHVVPNDADLLIVEQLLLQHLFGAQLFTAMNDRH